MDPKMFQMLITVNNPFRKYNKDPKGNISSNE